MARMTGKRALMEMLKVEGIEYIFGNPGTSESPILDELERHPELRYFLVTQEGVAMGMADGYARSTQRPAFVNLHIETGLANGISLLNNAYEGGTPMVLTSANKDVRKLAEGRTDLAGMVRMFTKWSAEVTHPEQVPSILRRAFNEAKTPPTGPTYVGFSANALDEEGEIDIAPSFEVYSRSAPDPSAVETAGSILGEASHPVIIVGDRVAQSGASDEAVRLAEILGARVYAGRYSEMNFPSDHPQFLGLIGPATPAGRQILASGDAVLALGRDSFGGFFHFLDRALAPGAKLIHIDSSGSDIGRSEPTDVGIVADPKTALAHLADALEASMSGSMREAAKGRAAAVAEEKAAQQGIWEAWLRSRWDAIPMSPERMMTEVAAAIPSDALIADDSVSTRPAVFGAMDFRVPGAILGERGGAIGWGMGGAMGMKLANPDRPVVAVVGDGSAMMTVQALWTARQLPRPGGVRHLQQPCLQGP